MTNGKMTCLTIFTGIRMLKPLTFKGSNKNWKYLSYFHSIEVDYQSKLFLFIFAKWSQNCWSCFSGHCSDFYSFCYSNIMLLRSSNSHKKSTPDTVTVVIHVRKIHIYDDTQISYILYRIKYHVRIIVTLFFVNW